MKGVALIVVAAIISLLVTWGVYAANRISELETIRRTVREVGITDVINALEFVKRSLEQSAAYSFYQSSYEVAKGGGYLGAVTVKNLNGIPYWRYYADTTGFSSNFEQTLSTRLLNILKEYADKLTFEGLTIPGYSSTIFGKTQAGVVVLEVLSPGELNLDKTPIVVVSDVANMKREINSNFFNMFDISKLNFVTTDSIQPKLQDAIDATPLENSGSLTQCGPVPSDEAVFTAANGFGFSEAKEKIKANIQPQLDSLEFAISTDIINFDISAKETAANIDPSCTVSTPTFCGDTIVDENLGSLTSLPALKTVSRTPVRPGSESFKVKNTDTDETATAGYTVVSYSAGQFSITSSPLGTGSNIVVLASYQTDKYRQTKSCTFSFYAAAKVAAAVKDLQNKYPVYDGTTNALRDLILNFAVLSCNVYDQNLCQLS